MKKILAIGIFFLIPVFLHAQGPVSFGPKLGWNSSKLTTDYARYIEDMRDGVQGGLFFSLYMDKFYLQPEAYISLRRGNLDAFIEDPGQPLESVNFSQSVKLTTVDIPLLLGYKIIDLKLIRFRVWGGPVVSYVLDKEFSLSLNGLDQSDRINRGDFKEATWAGRIGAGLDLLFLVFDVGYEFGLQDFMTIRSLDDFGVRSNMYFISLGWRLF